ncbi:MAG: hypothetical protein WD071_17390 [Pseudohongiella sp.]|uniref:hypothetical protein n=1 Tax=Pseudohongiella sp. TaxID=1979412 RepID=UPI00349FEDC1
MKSEQELDQAIAALPREMQPQRDLWRDLEKQLPERRHVRKRQMSLVNQALALAAVLALVVVVSWRVLVVPDNADMPVATTDVPDPVDDQLPPQYAIVQQYETLVAEQQGMLSRSTGFVGDWQYQLATWDSAIGQLRTALDYYPDDPQLLAQMQGLYAQQLDYLHLISSVEPNGYYYSGEEL